MMQNMVKPDCSSERNDKTFDLCYMTIKPVIEMVPDIRDRVIRGVEFDDIGGRVLL